MTKILFAIVAAASLAACNKQDHTIVAGSPGDGEPVNTAGIVLPPSIAASKTYRCKDNSLVYIDWLSDGTARVKKSKTEVGTQVTLGEAGAPLSGTATDASVTYNGQSCKG